MPEGWEPDVVNRPNGQLTACGVSRPSEGRGRLADHGGPGRWDSGVRGSRNSQRGSLERRKLSRGGSGGSAKGPP